MADKKEQAVGKEISQEEAMALLLGQSTNITKEVNLKRFGDLPFVLRPIDGEEMDQIQERATYYRIKGKNRVKEVDETLLQTQLLAHGIQSPDLGSDAFKKHYNETDPAIAIKKHFLAGELSFLSSQIMELSGFNEDEEETIETLKKQ